MADKLEFTPQWRNEPAREGTYREALMFTADAHSHPSDAWVSMFLDEFGIAEADFVPNFPDGDRPIENVPPTEMSEKHRKALADIVGLENISDTDRDRVKFGHGKSIDEDIALRLGETEKLPDLIVHPRDKQDVSEIVAYCHEHRIPVVPFGAGSSVVIGTRADFGGVIIVLRTHMNKLIEINEEDQVAVVQPGMMGPDYEIALNTRAREYGANGSWTGGHFPQSFEIATVGGWVTALGSGQASTYYGDAYDLVVSQEYVTPIGTLKTHAYAATANGPKLNDILKGSEGAFGILVEVTLKIFPHRPQNTSRFAMMLPSWEAAVNTAREIVQGEFGKPAVLRISDPEETERGLALKGFDSGVAAKYLAARGMKSGSRCLLIGTAEGHRKATALIANESLKIGRNYGGISLTSFATKKWEAGRYSDVHVRNDIMDFGMVIDTLETSVTWSNLHHVHQSVRSVIEARGGTMCMSHASHFYEQGTNLYFIMILKPESMDEFFEFRTRVIEAILAAGGSPSHHHGIGRLFRDHLPEHLGEVSTGVLRALKTHFDPRNIMNPGVLLDTIEQTRN